MPCDCKLSTWPGFGFISFGLRRFLACLRFFWSFWFGRTLSVLQQGTLSVSISLKGFTKAFGKL